jgi:NitT/TauT family transport system substrate-binding protein
MHLNAIRFLFALCVGGLMAVGSASSAAAQDKVRVSLPVIAAGNVFHFLAQDKGLYREEKIDPTFEVTAPMVGVQATIAGDFQFTGSGVASILAALKGAPMKIVFGQIPKVLWWLYGQSDIASAQALKGKTIGIEGPGTLSDVLTRDALKQLGLNPDRDVQFLGLGPVPNWYAALRGKTVAAAIVYDPDIIIRAKADGFREIFFYGDHTKGVIYNLATSEKLLREKNDLVKRFLRASLKGIRVFLEDKNAGVQAIQKAYKADAERAQEIYRLIVPHFDRNADVSDEIIKESVATLARTAGFKGELPPVSRFYDGSLVRQAAKEIQASGWKVR